VKAIAKNRNAVREALANEGWRFSVISSTKEYQQHRDSCRMLSLPSGTESDSRVRTFREELLRPIPWEIRSWYFPRWLGYISKAARKKMQHHLPIAAELCLTHGFIFLVGDVWAERVNGRWRVHRADGPAVIVADRELYYWRGWHVPQEAVTDKPGVERILAEENLTNREVLLQRMGVENFVREAELKPFDTFRDSTLLKVDTPSKRGAWRDGRWTEMPLQLAFLKVVCPSTQKNYFLRVDPDVDTAKRALESTLPIYRRDWERDLVAET
jgi:hypothetical protein